MFYTYMHTRNDTGQPFYIGKGKGKRANTSNGRSEHWHRIVEKHGHKAHILAHWTSESEAFEHEKFLIACFRGIGTALINKTEGGEGCAGRSVSESTRNAIRAKKLGRAVSQETRDKLRLALTGKATGCRYIPSPEVRSRISDSLKGKRVAPFDEKHRANIAASARLRSQREATPVLCIETGLVFATAMDAQVWLRQNGYPKASRGNVLNVCNGKPRYNTAYGYHWNFKT